MLKSVKIEKLQTWEYASSYMAVVMIEQYPKTAREGFIFILTREVLDLDTNLLHVIQCLGFSLYLAVVLKACESMFRHNS